MDRLVFFFDIGESYRIAVEIEDSFDKVDCCYEGSFFLEYDDQKILLFHDSIFYSLGELQRYLKKALAGDLILHESMVKDLGYLYNQYCASIWSTNLEKNESFTLVTITNNTDYWIGDRYRVWDGKLVMWLYNSSDGSIVLECTPMYPEGFEHLETPQEIASYKKWLDSYSPLLRVTISRAIAEKWLLQTNELIEKITKNGARLEAKIG